jgi:hypothetical protein
MDTSLMIEVVFYLVISAMTSILVVLTLVYIFRLSSSKGSPKLNRESGHRLEESTPEEKAESQPVLESSSENDIYKRAVPSGEEPLKPEPAAIEVPLEVQEIGKVASPKNMGPRPITESITYINVSNVGIQKQLQPEETASAQRSKQTVALKDDSVSHTPLNGAARGQLAMTRPKSNEEPAHELPPDKTSPAAKRNEPTLIAEATKITKESEPSMDKNHGTKVNKSGSEPPAATANSGETSQNMPKTQKSSMGDLSDLFAKSNSEDKETNKLAAQVNDVDVNELLQEGLVLLEKLRKFDHQRC